MDYELLFTCIFLQIKFFRSSENVHRKANQEPRREEKSDFKSSTPGENNIQGSLGFSR